MKLSLGRQKVPRPPAPLTPRFFRPGGPAQNKSGRRSAIDRRTTRHPGYASSQRIRKRIEEAFGWIKSVAGMRRTKLRGLARVDWAFTFAAAAYNLVRAPKLLATST